MTLFRGLFVLCLAGLIIGCATEGPGSGGTDVDGKADVWGESGSTSHREAVLQCERMQNFALGNAMSTAEISQALYGYQECLSVINDRARELIEQHLADIESPAYGTSLQTFADYRWAVGGICGTSVDWGDGADGTMSQTVRANCIAEGERALSDLIDSFVYFEQQEPVQIEEDRNTFAACYDEQDAALENAMANNEMIQAMHGSADCIEIAMENRVGALVQATLFTFPDRDAFEVEEGIREVFETMFDLNAVMCGLVSEAGESGGGTMAQLVQADCRSDASELMYRFGSIGDLEAATDGIRAHLELGQTPLVHPTLGVWALYAPGAAVGAFQYNTLAELFAGTPGAQQSLEFGTCMVEQGSVEFDCEEFSAQGCFMSDASSVAPITHVLQMAEEYELYTPTAEEYQAASATELHIESMVVVTNAYMSLYYGDVDGELCLLMVDLASFSCDA